MTSLVSSSATEPMLNIEDKNDSDFLNSLEDALALQDFLELEQTCCEGSQVNEDDDKSNLKNDLNLLNDAKSIDESIIIEEKKLEESLNTQKTTDGNIGDECKIKEIMHESLIPIPVEIELDIKPICNDNNTNVNNDDNNNNSEIPCKEVNNNEPGIQPKQNEESKTKIKDNPKSKSAIPKIKRRSSLPKLKSKGIDDSKPSIVMRSNSLKEPKKCCPLPPKDQTPPHVVSKLPKKEKISSGTKSSNEMLAKTTPTTQKQTKPISLTNKTNESSKIPVVSKEIKENADKSLNKAPQPVTKRTKPVRTPRRKTVIGCYSEKISCTGNLPKSKTLSSSLPELNNIKPQKAPLPGKKSPESKLKINSNLSTINERNRGLTSAVDYPLISNLLMSHNTEDRLHRSLTSLDKSVKNQVKYEPPFELIVGGNLFQRRMASKKVRI